MINFKFIVIIIKKMIIVTKLYSIFYKITYQVLLQKKHYKYSFNTKIGFSDFLKFFKYLFFFNTLSIKITSDCHRQTFYTFFFFFFTSDLFHLDNMFLLNVKVFQNSWQTKNVIIA